MAASLKPGARYRLQLIGGSQVYGPVRGAGAITVLGRPDRAAYGFSLKRLNARSIDSSASSRGYQPSTLTTFHSGVL